MNPSARPHRGLMFWAITPLLMLFVVLMPFQIQRHDLPAIAVLVLMEIVGVLMLLGLYDPHRFAWAWRGVGGLVFLTYAAYVVVMLVDRQWQLPANRAQGNLFNAIAGLCAFGLPGLWWAVFGRVPPIFRGSLHPDADAEISNRDLEEPQS